MIERAVTKTAFIRATITFLLFSEFTLGFAPPVFAQDTLGEESAESELPPLVPPRLIEYVEAEYPPAAFEQGLEAEVLAQLDIDVNGVVLGVEIVEPAGHGFDEAATRAMMQFVFEPARRGDEKIAALLFYRYRFFIKKETPAPAPEEPEPGVALSGVVTDMEDDPLSAALVVLSEVNDEEAVEPLEKMVETDSDGRFSFVDIPAGEYQLEVVASGFNQFYMLEEMQRGEEREVHYRLETGGSQYEIIVRGKKPPREVTRREISAKEITMIPGTSGDALRAVQNLPGMARASAMDGDIIVRGSSPEDTAYFFNSMNTPFIYHFAGLTSVINSDLLEEIEFYPGNFSVKYGRATGGIVDVTTRAPMTDRFHGYIDADIWDVGILGEGPINDDWSIAVSARRSYIDAILTAIDLGDDFQMTVAPRYYDMQVIADYHPSENNNLHLLFFGTDDRLVFVYDNIDSNPNEGGGDNVHLFVYQAQARWSYRFNKRVSNEFDLGFGYWGGSNSYGSSKEEWNILPLLIRDEITWNPGEKFLLRVGTDTELRWGQVKMKVPDDYGGEGYIYYDTSAFDEQLTFKGKRFHVRPSLYSELELTAVPRTTFIYGLRVDYHSPVDRWSLDPRVAVRYKLFDHTTLKAGLGLFHQAPDYAQADKDYGNPNLKLTSAIHYSVGIEQELFENIEIGVEGFYKELDNLITMSEEIVERNDEMVPERFDNDGMGKVLGLEVMLKHRPTDRFFGWIAYTLMKSERVDEPDGKSRPFDYDQTHILTAVGSLHIGWGVDIGVRYRLVSGNPYTPVLGASYDADSDLYVPLYGGLNSARMPLFHQLDIRVDKKWQGRYLAFTVYLDVKNVYNQQNPEGRIYSTDFSEKDYFYGLPILPSLGLKLEY